MRRRCGTVAVAVSAVGLCQAPALGAVTAQPLLQLPAFTRPDPRSGGGLEMQVRWAAPIFSPQTDLDAVNVRFSSPDSGGGAVTTFGSEARKDSTAGVGVTDGRVVVVQMVACQAPSVPDGCDGVPPAVTQVTRVDGTAPTATVRIDGGAVATNDRTATLEITATDPPVGTIPGSASGVAGMAVDEDGDGVFPCATLLVDAVDRSGCARAFATGATVPLTGGDGVKTVGVRVGDGARPVTTPCRNPRLCVRRLADGSLQGNVSATATDTILLDTTAPTAVVSQDRFTVPVGGVVTVDAGSSTDGGPAPAGVDPGTATWDFADGTAPETGPTRTHTFTRPGTFTGTMTVRDRAGNVSAARTFGVTVTAPTTGGTGGTQTGGTGGAVGTVTTAGAFRLTTLRADARYARSRLTGSLRIAGTADAAGSLTAVLTPRSGPPRAVRARIPGGAFDTTLRLPAALAPGVYALAITAPGGGARSTLTIAAPPEGVVGAASLRVRHGAAAVRFAMVAAPVTSLRRRMTVTVTQAGRRLAVRRVTLDADRIVRVTTPPLRLSAGRIVATLRAGTTVVATVAARVR